MKKKNGNISAIGAALAIAFTVLHFGCRPVGENGVKVKNAAIAVDGADDRGKGTIFGDIQGNFEPKDRNAPRRSVLASVPRAAGVVLAYSPDGNTIATATFKGPIQLTRLAPNGLVHTLAGTESLSQSSTIAFSPDSVRVAMLGHAVKSSLAIWDVASGRQLISIPEPENYWRSAFAWSPDGSSLAVVVSNASVGWVKLINAADGAEITVFKVKDFADLVESNKRRDGYFSHQRLAFSPDGKRLAATIRFQPLGQRMAPPPDNKIVIWDVASGNELVRFGVSNSERHRSDGMYELDWLGFHPDGQRLVTVSRFESDIRFWDASTGRETMRLDLHHHPTDGFFPGRWPRTISFRPKDNAMVAVLGGRLQIWDIKAASLRVYAGESGHVTTPSLSSWPYIAVNAAGDRLLVSRRDDKKPPTEHLELWSIEPLTNTQ